MLMTLDTRKMATVQVHPKGQGLTFASACALGWADSLQATPSKIPECKQLEFTCGVSSACIMLLLVSEDYTCSCFHIV